MSRAKNRFKRKPRKHLITNRILPPYRPPIAAQSIGWPLSRQLSPHKIKTMTITNQKTATIIRLGYYHPSIANWNYEIFLVMIDGRGVFTATSKFGGDYRLSAILSEQGFSVSRSYAQAQAEYKWKDIYCLQFCPCKSTS